MKHIWRHKFCFLGFLDTTLEDLEDQGWFIYGVTPRNENEVLIVYRKPKTDNHVKSQLDDEDTCAMYAGDPRYLSPVLERPGMMVH
jgi:hypothetical protein